jgi:hypothetical protein
MGLESVEMVMKVEETFDITLDILGCEATYRGDAHFIKDLGMG